MSPDWATTGQKPAAALRGLQANTVARGAGRTRLGRGVHILDASHLQNLLRRGGGHNAGALRRRDEAHGHGAALRSGTTVTSERSFRCAHEATLGALGLTMLNKQNMFTAKPQSTW